MVEIIKEKMKAGIVYIAGRVYTSNNFMDEKIKYKLPFLELSCLDNNGTKVSLFITSNKESNIIVEKNDFPFYTFKDWNDFTDFLNKNTERGGLQEIYFLWTINNLLHETKYEFIDPKEKNKIIIEDAKKVIKEKFNQKINDNINSIFEIYNIWTSNLKDKEAFKQNDYIKSPELLAEVLRERRDDSWKLADKIHADVFDLVFSEAIGEEESYLQELRTRITENRRKFLESVYKNYDIDLKLSSADWFNQIIMPATKM
ncbi:MAG: hypothetical protein K5829_09365 [Treponema sp.]|nr:hypothetical protein [Treponema sp.]